MTQLFWLPIHPSFAAALKAARALDDPAPRLRAAVALAGVRRDFIQTTQVDQLASGAIAGAGPASNLRPYRIAILASHTVDHLLPAIRVAGLGRGLALEMHLAAYGQYRQSLLGDDADLAAFSPQMVVLALDAMDAPVLLPLTASEERVAEMVARRVDELRLLWRRAAARFGATVVQQTLLPTDPPVFGSFDRLAPGSPTSILDHLNAAIRDAARTDGVLLLDMEWCKALAGHDTRVFDPVRWHHAKQLVHPAAAPTYGEALARIAAAAAGLMRKCLVVDLDNTLWGGVVGDDGPEGLQLGQGNPTGEAFAAFQRSIALLAERGIILAVCSKNDAAMAEAGFAHPGMVLKRDAVAAFVANWDDKATNLRRIARTLDIGLDALVFVDDNPAERDIVRRELPEVAVPELPDDVAEYPAILAAAGWFEAASFTQDDAARGRSYAANAERTASLERTSDLDSYLRDLTMRMTAARVDAADFTRTVQLLNKTNQFNLTTRRYAESEFRLLLERPGAQAWTFRLADRFGDNGLISVVVLRPDARFESDALLIDSWVMSCRVLGRQAEHAVLAVIAGAARAAGASSLVGEYRPTDRNGMVADHYRRLGFTPFPASPAGPDAATFWRLGTAGETLPPHAIEIVAP